MFKGLLITLFIFAFARALDQLSNNGQVSSNFYQSNRLSISKYRQLIKNEIFQNFHNPIIQGYHRLSNTFKPLIQDSPAGFPQPRTSLEKIQQLFRNNFVIFNNAQIIRIVKNGFKPAHGIIFIIQLSSNMKNFFLYVGYKANTDKLNLIQITEKSPELQPTTQENKNKSIQLDKQQLLNSLKLRMKQRISKGVAWKNQNLNLNLNLNLNNKQILAKAQGSTNSEQNLSMNDAIIKLKNDMIWRIQKSRRINKIINEKLADKLIENQQSQGNQKIQLRVQ